ncbi:hypothetical protein BDW02DRAFT_593003 [Decorospora gaudefroyi]|uniref:F-box domain-containing protein n=1 Tax=Decorospora gaudefroyi TaxID=184978 RepID=A0A6A5K3L1_9PLEO|nr:hypothetical protein BDW02DRAFT_593003 [Decorospora gaudefroyi]
MELGCLETPTISFDPSVTPLLNLPSELVTHILAYLNFSDLLSVSLVNKALREHSLQDTLWQPFVQAEVPGYTVPKPGHMTWRELFQQHHPYWFISRRKIWFADSPHTGKLLVARYDHRLNAIEAYALGAERRQPTFLAWDQHPEAIIHTFSPRVQLDLNAPVIRLNAAAYAEAIGNTGHRLPKEVPMSLYREMPRQSAGLYSQLLLTKPWLTHITTSATPVWPPLTLPSRQRARNDISPSGLRALGQKPSLIKELSTCTFRIRKWMEFSTRAHGVSMRIGEDITTFASLPKACWTPTARKPWQGIWCGDYAGHGCEFLLIMQPDHPRPLPERAEWAMRARDRAESVSSEGSWSTAPTDSVSPGEDAGEAMVTADDVGDSVATLQGAVHSRSEASSAASCSGEQEETVYQGRIEAVKLTGDPNIPRGEYTFIAPDIGPNGLLRVATEDIFKGARIVKSVGHIAARGFRDDNYMSSQLILISHDRLAQYWETFGHVSFYQRVDIDAFTRV